MKTSLKWLSSVAMLTMLAACGNSDNETPESLYSLSGTVSGLNGSLVVAANTNTFTINSNGNIDLGSNYTSGTSVNLSISSQPDSQLCSITSDSTVTFTDSNINNVAIDCVDVFSISGEATGLGRGIELQYNYDQQTGTDTIATNGSFTLSSSFIEGTEVNFTVLPTVGHNCTVSPQSIVLTENIDNLSVECNTFGQVTGRVSAYDTGNSLSGAKIEAYVLDQDNQATLLQTTNSDDEGNFSLIGTGYFDRISLRATAENYATRSEVVRTNELNPDTTVSIAMLNVDFTETFSATEAKDIIDPETALRISLPENAFVDSQGNTYTGQVTAAITNIDASSDPAIMPGYYLAIDPQAQEEMVFESFGALNATFSDANNNTLQLANDKTAQIRIPLATRGINPPATIPLIHFNEQTGIWDVEGEAQLLTDEQDRQYYAGEVAHFSTWNADYLFESVTISGCALDDETQTPIPGVRLIADGVDYIGRSVAYTNAAGEFSIAVRPNSEVLLSIRDADGQSNTMRINVPASNMSLDNCLTTEQGAMIVSLSWGEHPRDLDTHFKGPTVANSLTERFHIYYSNRSETVEGVTMYLDVDDTDSFGPEVLTIPSFPLAGSYIYSVKHYSGSSTIFQSPTRVEVLLNGVSYVFSPSVDADTNGENDTWLVFEVTVSDEGTVALSPIDSYTNVNNNDIPEAISVTPQKALAVKQKAN
ncbi:YfaP family protein [Rheinheimera sp. WS51]|uniref:YfaP family protein n=1 Tax=Rheinheimera sp. WS51 TaxID=3425886 RepID=UPI003D8B1FB8